MQIIILLNGSINSGKTTISKQLKKRLPNTAHIEVDDLRAFVDWMSLEESIPLNIQNALAVSHTFLDYGLNIVLSYPLGARDMALVQQSFKKYPVLSVTLRPELKVALSNRGQRELSSKELDRIPHHYRTEIAYPEYESLVIDNSDELPEETADTIIRFLQKIEKNPDGCFKGYSPQQ